MEAYGQALLFIIPVFLLLFYVEMWVEKKRGLRISRPLDSISSFSSGITNVVKDVLGLSIGIISYGWMVENWAIFHIQSTWAVFLIAFVAMDFHGYWSHRLSHEINFLWNRHIIHHSSEEFNLACALRQSISQIFNYFVILLLPAALLGVPAEVVAVIGPVHLFLQYWYHTRLIGRMGWLETWLVTPSHHRVHHAMNPEYLDKNYGQIFIFWDRWFGTFQAELPEVEPIYGVKRPVGTWNPFRINFQHFQLLAADAFVAKNWWDKLRLWFMPTGWRPADAAQKRPVEVVSDVFSMKKYDPPAPPALVRWSWAQLYFQLFLLGYLFLFIGKIGSPDIFWLGGFVFLSVWAMTEQMDSHALAPFWELLKCAVAAIFLFKNGSLDWFGSTERAGVWYAAFVLFWQVLAAAMALFFWSQKMKKTELTH